MSALFIILVGLTMTGFSEKMLVATRCIHDFMSNLIKKSKSRLSYRLVLLLPFIFPGWIIWVINFSKSWCVIPKDNKLDDFGATHLCRGKLESNHRCSCPSFIPNVFESKAFWILVSLICLRSVFILSLNTKLKIKNNKF